MLIESHISDEDLADVLLVALQQLNLLIEKSYRRGDVLTVKARIAAELRKLLEES